MPEATHNPAGHLSTGDDLSPPPGGLSSDKGGKPRMPSLLEELKSRLPEKRCRFGTWIETASKQDRADLATAFADPTIPGQLIADVLADRISGWVVDDIRKHRRGTCKVCPRELLNG